MYAHSDPLTASDVRASGSEGSRTMSKETTDLGKQGDWRGLAATMGDNTGDLAHLEPLRLQLVAQADKALDIGKQLAGLTAGKQDLSKQLRVVIVGGGRPGAVCGFGV